ncbi:MAG: DNA-directed RNA polymerase subunit alpha [Candidatus Kaiserbacteria bacterium]|nr:DNA-directed RNA polymerase subunit alpha [Candidatus Kaiserbacteria bacterium]
MTEYINIAIPSKPEIVQETDTEGTYEISSLYPGYGNTLGNALRRMLLSSIPGVAITTIRIQGVPHEFSALDGIKQDALTVIVNMKNIRVKANTDTFPQRIALKKKGKGVVTAGDFEAPSQVEVINKDLVIAEIADDKTELQIEADIQQGIGFRPREDFSDDSEVGSIVVDAIFSPVKRSSYEVENMRVGERTDFNRLSLFIETDGTITPREALEKALRTMLTQFEAMLGFQSENKEKMKEIEQEANENMKVIAIQDLDLSATIVNALEKNNIQTVMDLLKKGAAGIREIPGIGTKAVEEITERLEGRGIILKDGE